MKIPCVKEHHTELLRKQQFSITSSNRLKLLSVRIWRRTFDIWHSIFTCILKSLQHVSKNSWQWRHKHVRHLAASSQGVWVRFPLSPEIFSWGMLFDCAQWRCMLVRCLVCCFLQRTYLNVTTYDVFVPVWEWLK